MGNKWIRIWAFASYIWFEFDSQNLLMLEPKKPPLMSFTMWSKAKSTGHGRRFTNQSSDCTWPCVLSWSAVWVPRKDSTNTSSSVSRLTLRLWKKLLDFFWSLLKIQLKMQGSSREIRFLLKTLTNWKHQKGKSHMRVSRTSLAIGIDTLYHYFHISFLNCLNVVNVFFNEFLAVCWNIWIWYRKVYVCYCPKGHIPSCCLVCKPRKAINFCMTSILYLILRSQYATTS